MTTITINAAGIEQIATAMGQHHKQGRAHFTPAMLAAWAADAEESWASGNDAAFEIPAKDTHSGRPEVVVIGESGYDTHTAVDA